MAREFTLDFNDITPCLKDCLGMMALSNLSTEEYMQCRKNIEKVIEIWNKKQRKEFGND